jgi:23S rRNA-/tRNA-specific pseudouridylate synthase
MVKYFITIFKKAFRFVKPYEQKFEINSKKEWKDQRIIDILSKEFILDIKYCREFFKSKLIMINNGYANENDKIKENDKISYTEKLRIEPCTINFEKIEIVYEDEELFVINKPCSYPVHEGIYF